MTPNQRDPIVGYLDRLAHLADNDHVVDRMHGIERRVRTAHRRKAGLAIVAAGLVTLGGAGLWQALPDRDAQLTNSVEPWQSITVEAQAQRTGALQIRFTIAGESTVYYDPTTQKWLRYAGPASTEVRVDGKTITGSDGSSMECRQGGDLRSYRQPFYASEPLVVPVEEPGKHEVVVTAPYCVDGTLVESVQRVVVSTDGAPSVADQQRADVDGDGTNEVVRVLVPADSDKDQLLEVTWSSGATASASFPNNMERGLRDPIDLDGDGDEELIVSGGGGEVSQASVFAFIQGELLEVSYVDSTGRALEGLYAYAETRDWNVNVEPDGIFSARNPTLSPIPAPVQVRRWTLSGRTLSESATTSQGCLREDGLGLESC